MATNRRHRNFCFTMNNYPDTSLVDSVHCKYIIYGKEVAATGTKHLQGFVVFDNAKTLSAAIKTLPGCHVEIAKTVEEAIEYCKKDGDFHERGTAPMSAADGGAIEANRWKRMREAAEDGRFEEIDDKSRFLHFEKIQKMHIHALHSRKLDDTEDQMLWYYGDSGTGKSRKARSENPEAYLKGCNKWWDGYTDHEVVIIEDFDRKHDVLAHHMKIWADRYPFPAEVKGGSMTIRPRKIIVTSNYHPKDIWTNPSDLEPILRRFQCIKFLTLAQHRANTEIDVMHGNVYVPQGTPQAAQEEEEEA